MKTVKYFIEFENLENNMGKLEISKSEFQKQLKHMRNQVEKTKDYETPITEDEVRVYEHNTTTETIYIFTCACADTYLTEVKCKEGYCFKSKK